jgi:hypothetical protein
VARRQGAREGGLRGRARARLRACTPRASRQRCCGSSTSRSTPR